VRARRSISRSPTRQRRRRHDRRPARQRADARQQLGEGEGFYEIVVAAGVEARHAIVDAAHGGEEQHRRAHMEVRAALTSDRPSMPAACDRRS
jgi:hypothetical protein